MALTKTTPDEYLPPGSLSAVPLTGVQDLDALFGSERWSQASSGTLLLSFSFVRPGSRFDSTSEEAERATPLPGWVQDLIRAGLRHFEQIIDIRFVEVQETSNQVGVLRFSGLEGSHPDMAAFEFMPSVGPWGGDVFFYEDQLLESNLDYLQSTILHEIGHALGLMTCPGILGPR